MMTTTITVAVLVAASETGCGSSGVGGGSCGEGGGDCGGGD
jgi:hypothetical protein